MAENKDISKENGSEINSSNIFEEFENDQKIVSEIEENKNQEEKDKYYYMISFSRLVQKILFVGIFILMFVFIYIFIQTDKNFTNNTYIKPFCILFTGDIENNKKFCSSASYIEEKLSNSIDNNKEKFSDQILDVLSNIYKKENFTKTKEVAFIEYKSKNKLEFTKILSSFNELRVGFDKVAKDRIQCVDFNIDGEDKVLNANCYAYSRGYEDNTIIGESGDRNDIKQSGTSISLANSFLNYIEKNSEDFILLDKQKIFKKDNVSGEVIGFTYKTNFKLKLKYNF